jgi:hypothetical protein
MTTADPAPLPRRPRTLPAPSPFRPSLPACTRLPLARPCDRLLRASTSLPVLDRRPSPSCLHRLRLRLQVCPPPIRHPRQPPVRCSRCRPSPCLCVGALCPATSLSQKRRPPCTLHVGDVPLCRPSLLPLPPSSSRAPTHGISPDRTREPPPHLRWYECVLVFLREAGSSQLRPVERD